jgi:DMSO/TMAO reductase YedYZ heme-binding membrane subunit
MVRFTLILFIISYGYAAIRYHIGADVPFDEWYFILNKSLAWTGFTLVAMSILKTSTLHKWKLDRRGLGLTGIAFAFIHALSVLVLFSETHYSKLFTEHEINIQGYIALSLGFVSLLIFSFPLFAALKRYPNEAWQFRLGKYGVLVNIFHPMIIGFTGWFGVDKWPLGLPPITLFAVVMGIWMWVWRIAGK